MKTQVILFFFLLLSITTAFASHDVVYQYEGKEMDHTGFIDYHARQYAPRIGIFMQPDTMIPDMYHPGDLNRYLFERGNPLNNLDPTGHQVVPVFGEPAIAYLPRMGFHLPNPVANPIANPTIGYNFPGGVGMVDPHILNPNYIGPEPGYIPRHENPHPYEIIRRYEVQGENLQEGADVVVDPYGNAVPIPEGGKYYLGPPDKKSKISRIRAYDKNNVERARLDPPDRVTKVPHSHRYDETGRPLDQAMRPIEGIIEKAQKSPLAHHRKVYSPKVVE